MPDVKRILLSGSINSGSVEPLIEQIFATNDDGFYDRIELHISSGGGSLSAAFALCNAMRMSKIPVNTVVISMCGSAAMCLLEVGVHRSMMRQLSQLMMHPIKVGSISDERVGEAIASAMDVARAERDANRIVSERVGMTPEEYKAFVGDSRYLSAEQALELGFIDEIIDTPCRQP